MALFQVDDHDLSRFDAMATFDDISRNPALVGGKEFSSPVAALEDNRTLLAYD